jgi:hypothetical protein
MKTFTAILYGGSLGTGIGVCAAIGEYGICGIIGVYAFVLFCMGDGGFDA